MELGETSQPEQNKFSHEHTEQPMPESNAIGPSTELTTQAEWKQFLESEIENFWGDVIENAATLMAAFTEGKSYLYEKLTKRGLKSFVKPRTVILLDRNASQGAFGASNEGQLIFVKKSFLERTSDNDIHEIMQFGRPDGTVTYEGTPPDIFRLTGVEETHHTAFMQIKKGRKGIDPLSTTVADYDARENEYRALKWQVRYAQERLMPDITINLLRNRLAAAKVVRANRQK